VVGGGEVVVVTNVAVGGAAVVGGAVVVGVVVVVVVVVTETTGVVVDVLPGAVPASTGVSVDGGTSSPGEPADNALLVVEVAPTISTVAISRRTNVTFDPPVTPLPPYPRHERQQDFTAPKAAPQ
jgi:hypothetical protein